MALATQVFGILRDSWNRWSIQASVLASLAIQIILLFSGRSRKRTKDQLKIFVIWSIYLLADIVAMFAIGLIYNDARPTYITTAAVAAVGEISAASQACSSSCDVTAGRQPKHMAAFWAPFLLLHLGGPDTITAFSIEDNELWHRHLLTLIVQVVTVLLVFFRYQTLDAHNNPFLIPTLLISVAGFIKYAERTYSFKLASLTNMMKSMRPKQLGLMEEMSSVKIEVDGHHEVSNNLTDTEVVEHGFKFYKIFRRLVFNDTFGFDEWKDSKSFFSKLDCEDAFKVMEVELSFMYEAMFTKMISVQGKILGYTFRLATFFLIVAATVFFVVSIPKNDIHHLDLKVTHCLLAGAVILDVITLMELFLSDWTVALILMSKERPYELLKECAQRINKVCKWISSSKRWSGEIYQYSFISHSLKKQGKRVDIILDCFGLKEKFYSYLYSERQPVTDKLRELIFNEVKEIATQTPTAAKKIIKSKGKRTLLRNNCGESIMAMVKNVGFIERVLLWHIATEICYFNLHDYNSNDDDDDPEICRYISEYLVYLLVMEKKFTSALVGNLETDGFRDTYEKILETTFKYTREEARNFFSSKTMIDQELDNDEFKTYICGFRVKHVQEISICLGSMWISMRDAILYIAKLKCFFNNKNSTTRGMTLRETWKRFKEFKKRKFACQSLTKVTLQQEQSEVKGGSKSVLFNACILAKDMQDFWIEKKEMWKVMRSVWVELLLYGAYHCKGDAHAQRLARGGEFLTFVWLLMAHFGLGKQFRVQTVTEDEAGAGSRKGKIF